MHRRFAKRPLLRRITALMAAYAIALSGLIASVGAVRATVADAAASDIVICQRTLLGQTAPSGDHRDCSSPCCVGCLMLLAGVPLPPRSSVAVTQPPGRLYMTLANKANTVDRLTGASSDVATKVQIHEMAVVNGVMQMRQLVNGLAIPAGGSVSLKSGRYHVMLIDLKKPLTAGETLPLPLTLSFERAGNISVSVPVRAMGAPQNSQGTMSGMGMQASKPAIMGTMERK